MLIIAPIIAFGCTWLAALHFTKGENTWEEYRSFFMFPLAGIFSALAAVATTKTKLYVVMFVNDEEPEVELLLTRKMELYED